MEIGRGKECSRQRMVKGENGQGAEWSRQRMVEAEIGIQVHKRAFHILEIKP